MASIIFVCVVVITIYAVKSYKKVKQMYKDVATIADYAIAIGTHPPHYPIQDRVIVRTYEPPEPEEEENKESTSNEQ